jgi:hypothetical protein
MFLLERRTKRGTINGPVPTVQQPFRLRHFYSFVTVFHHFLETAVPQTQLTRAHSSLLHAGGSTKTQ